MPHSSNIRHYTQSSSFQMAVVFTVLCGLSVLILGYFSYYFQKDSFIISTEALIDTEIKYISSAPDIFMPAPQDYNGRLYLKLEEGSSLPDVIPKDIEILTEGIILFRHTLNERRYAAKIYTFEDQSRLLIGVDISDQSLDYDFKLLLSVLSIALMILIISISYFLSVFVVRGTNQIAMNAKEIMDTGDLSRRLEVSSRWDDLGHMTVVLNSMLDRIEELMNGVRQVSDNIAHDLRTPLTRMRNQIETLHGRKAINPEVKAGLSGLLDESDYLLATFNSLLRISRIEAGKQRSQFSPVELHTLVSDVVEYYAPLAEEKEIGLNLESVISVTRGDRNLLFQAFANILDNAIKYTPQYGTVDIKLAHMNGFHILEITDSGPGVAHADQNKIFNRFYRTEKSRTTKGIGLGLSLVAAVIELHNGSVAATNEPVGLKITVMLP